MVLLIDFMADWGQLSKNTNKIWLIIIEDKMPPEYAMPIK
jgi:hypothetical protein